ncbi:hypothetical protein [Streptomyces sp. NPDC054794]
MAGAIVLVACSAFLGGAMRLKRVSLTAAISLVAGLTTATVGLTGSVALADSTAALPLSHYSHLLVDAAHQHLFFSQGPARPASR